MGIEISGFRVRCHDKRSKTVSTTENIKTGSIEGS